MNVHRIRVFPCLSERGEWDFQCLMSPGARLAPLAFAPKLAVVKEGRENHGIIELPPVVVSASLPAPAHAHETSRVVVFLGGFT